MEIKIFEKLPVYSVDIRNEVFVKEQGFCEEFDEADKIATHLVGFENDRSAATCRIIKRDDNSFLIGRIAVRKSFRERGYGSEIVRAAEEYIKSLNGSLIYIHAQIRAMEFYKKLGYLPIGEPDEDEGCPHQMMFRKI